MTTNYDVTVVGAGIVGSYFARRLAERGLSVLLLDKRAQSELGGWKNRGHNIDQSVFETLPIEAPSAEETLAQIDKALFRPAVGSPFEFELPMVSVDLPAFTARVNREAVDAGVEFLDETKVTRPIVEDGSVVGVEVERDGQKREHRSRLVADVSGIDAVVSSKLPAEFGFPRKLSRMDCLLVYGEDWEIGTDAPRPQFTYHAKWQGWSGPREKGVIGIGLGRFASRDEDPREMFEDYAREVCPAGGKRVWKTYARVPLRHPIDSMVGNGILLIGDSACQGKPLNGEGVSVMLGAAEQAQDVVVSALERGEPSAEALWDYNVRFHTDVGARFAIFHRLRYELSRFSDDEMEFLFQMQLYGPDDLAGIMGPVEVSFDARRLLGLVRAGARGARRPDLLFRLVRASYQGAKLRKLYKNYPRRPQDLPSWSASVAALYHQR